MAKESKPAEAATAAAKKPRYQENPLKKRYGSKEKKPVSASGLKKTLRDTKRQLQKCTNEVVKVELARKIAAAEHSLADLARVVHEESLAERYKYVKFVEVRSLLLAFIYNLQRKKVAKRIARGEALQLMLDYIDYYPVDLKYVALFPSKDDAASAEERARIMALVREASEAGLCKPGFVLRSKPLGVESSEAEAVQEPADIGKDDFFV